MVIVLGLSPQFWPYCKWRMGSTPHMHLHRDTWQQAPGPQGVSEALCNVVFMLHAFLACPRTVPTPIKIKLALPTSPPPCKKTQHPPPPKRRIFLGMGVFQQNEPKNARRPYNWRSIFWPQNCGRKNYGHEASSDSCPRTEEVSQNTC